VLLFQKTRTFLSDPKLLNGSVCKCDIRFVFLIHLQTFLQTYFGGIVCRLMRDFLYIFFINFRIRLLRSTVDRLTDRSVGRLESSLQTLSALLYFPLRQKHQSQIFSPPRENWSSPSARVILGLLRPENQHTHTHTHTKASKHTHRHEHTPCIS
jgi:hypothetical protein